MTWRQFVCALRGHLPITKRQPESVRTECFLCGYAIGSGWSTQGLKAPAGMADVKPLKARKKVRSFQERKRA